MVICLNIHPFNGPFPWVPRWAGTRKVKQLWILLKQETVSGSGISWAVCKSAPRSRQITTPAAHHSVFLQAGCPSCHPTNRVKALKRVANLHMSQLMPLPLTVSCFRKIQIGFTFLVPAVLGSPGKRVVKRVRVYAGYSCRHLLIRLCETVKWFVWSWLRKTGMGNSRASYSLDPLIMMPWNESMTLGWVTSDCAALVFLQKWKSRV